MEVKLASVLSFDREVYRKSDRFLSKSTWKLTSADQEVNGTMVVRRLPGI